MSQVSEILAVDVKVTTWWATFPGMYTYLGHLWLGADTDDWEIDEAATRNANELHKKRGKVKAIEVGSRGISCRAGCILRYLSVSGNP